MKKGTEAAVLTVLGILSVSVCVLYLTGKELAEMSRCGCGKQAAYKEQEEQG